MIDDSAPVADDSGKVRSESPDALSALRSGRELRSVEIDTLCLPPGVWDSDLHLEGCSVRTLQLKSVVLRGKVLCKGCTFGAVEADHAEFQRDVELQGCEASSISFERSRVVGDLDLRALRVSGDLSLQGVEVRGTLRLNQSSVRGSLFARWLEVGGEAQVMESTISGPMDFCEVLLRGPIYFLKTDFQSPVLLNDARFSGPVYFSYDEGTIQSIERTPSHILERMAAIRRKPRAANARIRTLDAANAVFERKLVFERITDVERASFFNAQFLGEVSFNGSSFIGPLDLTTSYATGELTFRDASFASIVCLDDAAVGQRVDFRGAHFGVDSVLSLHNLSQCEIAIAKDQLVRRPVRRSVWLAARRALSTDVTILDGSGGTAPERAIDQWVTLKRSFGQRQQHAEEDWAYWHLMHERNLAHFRRARGPLRRVVAALSLSLKWLVFELGFGWGVRVGNIAGTSSALVVLFAVCLVLLLPHMAPGVTVVVMDRTVDFASMEPLEALYVSAQAFISFTLGDWQFLGANQGIAKSVLTLEAVIGIICITLFVVAYTRKILR